MQDNNRKANVIRNIISGLLSKLITLIFPFIIRTLIIYKLGTEYVGLDSLFASVLQVLSLTELGFNSAMVFSMYKPISEKNNLLVNALLNFYHKIYTYLGFLILGLGLILMPFIPHLIKGGYPNDINIYYLYLIFLFNSVASYFLFAYKSSLLVALQRNDINTNIAAFSNAFLYIVQILILIFFPNYYLYVIGLPILTILSNIYRHIYTKRKYKQYRAVDNIPIDLRKDIYKRVKALAGHKLGSVVTNSANNIFISAYLGLIVLGTFNNYFYILNAIVGIIGIIYNSLLGSIGNSIASDSVEKNYKDFRKISMLYLWIIGVCVSCLLALYQPFMKIWVGQDLMLSNEIVYFLCVYFLIWRSMDVIKVYKDAAGMWWADRFKPYISVAVNILLNFILVPRIGIKGVLLATILSQTFIEIPWSAYVLFKLYFKRNCNDFYKQFIPYLTGIVITSIISLLISNQIKLDNKYYNLITKGVIVIISTNILYIMLLSKTKEFLSLKIKLTNIIKK